MLFLSSGSISTRISFTPPISRRTASSRIMIASLTEGGFLPSGEPIGIVEAPAKNSRRSIFISPLWITATGYYP